MIAAVVDPGDIGLRKKTKKTIFYNLGFSSPACSTGYLATGSTLTAVGPFQFIHIRLMSRDRTHSNPKLIVNIITMMKARLVFSTTTAAIITVLDAVTITIITIKFISPKQYKASKLVHIFI